MVLLLAGCGRSRAPTTPVSTKDPSAAGKTDAAPATEQPANGSTAVARSGASDAEIAAALAELTQALRKYSFEHQRLPKTFGEVVAAGYVKQMPQAPAGKKFEIDPKTVQVILVKQ
jgi:hypothetical protein